MLVLEKINISELIVTLGWESRVVNEAIDWWVQQGCLVSDGTFASLNDDESVWIKFQKTSEEQQAKYQEKGDVDEDSDEEDDEGDEDGSNPRIEYMEKFWDYARNMVILFYFRIHYYASLFVAQNCFTSPCWSTRSTGEC